MNELTDFVLTALQQAGSIVEPPAYGIHDVLLPEAAGRRWHVPDYLRLAFDETVGSGPASTLEPVTLVGYGHPLVEALAEELRARPANAQAYLNDVRLDKHGLLALGRKQLSLPNARLEELPREVERPALCHYLRFNFKAALITDEKREQLVSVWMDVQGGHAARVTEHAMLSTEPGFPHLPPEPLRWTADTHSLSAGDRPLTPATLATLLERATHAALDELAGALDRLQARAAHFLELDQARLTQYYDDLERRLERRLQGALPDRRPALADKLAATCAERAAKLADVTAKYHLRVELDLINLLLVAQPKVLLPVRVANRATQIQRTLVWDPLQHRLEPLVCDVCHRPGETLHLCVSGHLAHPACLLAEQCVDCKRVYCQLCADQMDHCVVCDRPVCRRSLIRCQTCGRGTCQEHQELCHAADGEPAHLPPVEPKPTPAPKKPAEPPKRKSRQPANRPPDQPRRGVTGHEIAAYVEPDTPLLTAYVLSPEQATIAYRQWQLANDGLAILCHCEKRSGCSVNNQLKKPARPERLTDQLAGLIDDLRDEYGVSARHVTTYGLVRGEQRKLLELTLPGAWRDAEAIGRARAGYEITYSIQLPYQGGALPLPPFAAQVERRYWSEVGSLLFAMQGLLTYEGVLDTDELLARVADLVRPGPWYTPKQGRMLLT
ncbi:MAG: hypothetical protein KKA73_29870, partial [Chloroflexi bacterium]|nr:hypothetical protein [Chloroflexota bacterium]